MAKKTNLRVYVDKDVMSNSTRLFEAVFAHMVKKEVDIAERRQFIVEYHRAVRQAKDPIAVIHEWVQVWDIVGFPFRNKPQAEEQSEEMSEAVIEGAKAGKKLREELAEKVKEMPDNKKLKLKVQGNAHSGRTQFLEENADESKGTEGRVSVDDGADEKEVNGQTPRDGTDKGDGSGDTGNKRKRNK